jgi:hypothetical protein
MIVHDSLIKIAATIVTTTLIIGMWEGSSSFSCSRRDYFIIYFALTAAAAVVVGWIATEIVIKDEVGIIISEELATMEAWDATATITAREMRRVAMTVSVSHDVKGTRNCQNMLKIQDL